MLRCATGGGAGINAAKGGVAGVKILNATRPSTGLTTGAVSLQSCDKGKMLAHCLKGAW